jgi:hypothetical protein
MGDLSQSGGWRIIAIEGNRALIESDDGRRAWALLEVVFRA